MTYDYQAEQQRDQELRMRAVIEQLKEMATLVDCCGDHTWLTTDDVEAIASECGVRHEYLQALKPKPKLEQAHANR